MAKQKAPDAIQKQFNKIQHKPGEAVYFTWLGCKKYGYVIRTKETNWGIQYTIDSEGTKYPCGIQIKTHKTTYTTGCINHDETRALGQQELVTRIQTGHSSTYSEIFRDTRRENDESRDDVATSKRLSTQNSKRTKSTDVRSETKNVVKPSAKGVRGNNSTKRGNTELDTAIQKQRDFLNGFVSKEV
jgi:hypothetical protein